MPETRLIPEKTSESPELTPLQQGTALNRYRQAFVSHMIFGRIDVEAQLAKALEFVDQSAAADAESFGGFSAIEIMFAQSLHDRLPFDVSQLLGFTHCVYPRRGRSSANLGRQMFGQNEFTTREQGSAL